MLEIRNIKKEDGTVWFNVSGSSEEGTLTMRIDNHQANVVEIKAKDADIYDGLVKTAEAYAVRRGISFNKENIIWKQTSCRQHEQ
ncbi:MAG: hypothetical protein FWG33_01965 [Oscillospiraceae bacterium]|nr:hypothetical protein [Oscillospiraceae bacterium]